MNRCVVTLCALAAALLIAVPAGSQTSTAELIGTVTDPSGAAVPNVKVVITARDTGFIREAVTNSVHILCPRKRQGSRGWYRTLSRFRSVSTHAST